MREMAVMRRRRVAAAAIVAAVASLASLTIVWPAWNAEHLGMFASGIAILGASCWLMQKAVRAFDLRCLTIPGCWYLTYVVMLFIPAFVVFFEHTGSKRYVYMLAVQSTALTVPFGVVFVNLISRFQSSEIRRYFDSPVAEPPITLHLAVAFTLALMACIGVMVIYLSEAPTIPLLHILRNPGDAMNASILRDDSLKLLNTRLKYVYSFLSAPVFPMLIMVSLGYYLVSRKRTWLALFLATGAFGLAYTALTTAKSPVAAIMLLVLIFVHLFRGGRIRKSVGLVGLFLVIAYPLLIILVTDWSEWDLDVVVVALTAIWNRLAHLPAEVLYWYFQLFPAGYFHGRSSSNLAWIMGWRYMDLANYVGLYGLGSRQASVTANGAFIGTLYADFGMPGVVFGGILAGMIMQGCQVYLLRRAKSVVNMAVYAYLMFAFWMLHSTSLPIVLVSNGVLLALLVPRMIGGAVSFLGRATRDERVASMSRH